MVSEKRSLCGLTLVLLTALLLPLGQAMFNQTSLGESIKGKCNANFIQILQQEMAPLPNGIPNYMVSITNRCPFSCAVGEVHVSCGEFASARLVNPEVFKRVSLDDCVVNGGNLMKPNIPYRFQYANTFKYELRIKSSSRCWGKV